jgi:hypothetical protein
MADRQDEIGAVDRLVDVVPLRQSGRAHVEVGSARHRALSHLGVEERDTQATYEVGERLGEVWAARGGAKHYERAFGAEHQGRRPVNRAGGGNRSLDWKGLEQGHIRLLSGDVLRQLQMNRPKPLLLRNPERIPHERRDAGGSHDLT